MTRRSSRGLLIAAEGLDGSGKTATLDSLERWLERRGRRVRILSWEPSRLVSRAALDPRSRTALTPRVAALLAAAEAQARIGSRVERRLARGEVVLADRYAWTAIARDVARGLEADWTINLHGSLPVPDLVLYHRAPVGLAVQRALAGRPASVRSTAVGAAYGDFVGRLLTALEDLADLAVSGVAAPWSTRVLILAVNADPSVNSKLARDVIRPLIESQAGSPE